MFKKLFKFFLGLLLLVLLVHHSVYFKKLSASKSSEAVAFNAKEYARTYVLTKIPAAKNKAVDIYELLSALKADRKKAFDTYSSKQHTGDLNYFLVKGQAQISQIDEEQLGLKSTNAKAEFKLALKYIFGNAARDCSDLISINDFSNTMDLNNVSEEINQLIRKEIIPSFIAKAKKGDQIEFIGALELSSTETQKAVEVIPLSLQFKSPKL
ncbi:MAG: DUF2291 family protein [Sphingobacteriaceae bacterium]